MSVLSVDLAWSRRSSSITSQDGRTFQATFGEGYQVTHTYDTTEVEILTATGIPRLGDRYYDTFAICKKVGPVSKVGPIYSIVPVEWDGEVGPEGSEDNPLNVPARYDWGQSISNEPIDQDVNGNPIVTVNGEQISGVTMDIADSVLNVTKNFAAFSPWVQMAYLQSVNQDVFANFAAGTGRFKTLIAKEQKHKGIPYFEVQGTIQFRYPYNTTALKTWWARTRHEGFYEKVGSRIVRAVDSNKEPTTKPVLLKADGTRETNPANAVWLEWERYLPLPYNSLGFFP